MKEAERLGEGNGAHDAAQQSQRQAGISSGEHRTNPV